MREAIQATVLVVLVMLASCAITFFVYFVGRRSKRWFCSHGWVVMKVVINPEEEWGRGDHVYAVKPAYTNILLSCHKCGALAVKSMRGEPR